MEENFLKDYLVLKIPIIMGDTPTWPERFGKEKILEIKKHAGPKKFASQMMLEPQDMHESALKPELLKSYNAELTHHVSYGVEKFNLAEFKINAANMVWDPSFNSEKSDASVVSFALFDSEGKVFLHDIKYLPKLTKKDGEQSNMSFQIEQVLNFMQKHGTLRLLIESNGIGRFLPEETRRAARLAGLNISVIEIISKRNKDERIVGALEPLLYAESLYFHERIWQSPIISEMSAWQPGGGGKDDGLDSLALAVLETRQKLTRIAPRTYLAATNFKI